MSFTMNRPIRPYTRRTIFALVVSTETAGIPSVSGAAARRPSRQMRSMAGCRRCHSVSTGTGAAPGRVETAPKSGRHRPGIFPERIRRQIHYSHQYHAANVIKCMQNAPFCIQPARIYGRCMQIEPFCIHPGRIYGRCMQIARFCIQPARCRRCGARGAMRPFAGKQK